MDARGEIEGDGEVEEAVRQMNSEAGDLRDRTRASVANMTPAAMEVDLDFPPTATINRKPVSKKTRQLKPQQGGKTGSHDTPTRGHQEGTMPVMDQDTPQIAKNRLMRGETKIASSLGVGDAPTDRPGSLTRRRSSFSSRGKRSSSSYESTGIISESRCLLVSPLLIIRSSTSYLCQGHLYKYIDPDLPESQRMRQLLVWVTSRAADSSSPSSKGKKKQGPDPGLPPLPPGGEELLKEVQNDFIRQIAEGKVDTNVYSDPTSPKKALKENEQNVRNRARERLFTEQIEECVETVVECLLRLLMGIFRRRKEDVAWAEVAQFYNARQSNILSTISQEKKASAKAKGKQRVTLQEPEDLEPWGNELPEEFRGANGDDVAKHLLESGLKGVRD